MKKAPRRWTPAEQQTVIDNLGKLDFFQIGQLIGKSELAVKLFVHRKRISYTSKVKTNHLLALLKLKFGHPEYFNPTKNFFRAVGITQMRYWALYRGECTISSEEYKSIREHFELPAEDVIKSRQLDLFEEN